MHDSGHHSRPLLSGRFDVIVGVAMVIVLISASAVGTVLDLRHGHGPRAGDTIGTSSGTALRNGGIATPSPAARPTPASPPASASLSPPLKQSADQLAPPAVTYASTGPSPAGAIRNNASTLSWTGSVLGSDTALLVAVAVGQQDDSGQSASATDDGNAMEPLARVQDNGDPDGFLEVFGLAGVPDGLNTIRVTVTDGPATELTGGSESFSGAAQEGTFSTPAIARGNGTVPAVTITSKPGGLVAAFAACGSAITGTAAPAAEKFVADDNDDTGAGNSAGATSSATGSNVTVAWSSNDDWWGTIAVQVNN